MLADSNIIRSRRLEVFFRKGVLRNFAKFTGKRPCQSLFFKKKETLTKVFSCEFCKISKSTFFHRIPLVAASVLSFSRFLLLSSNHTVSSIILLFGYFFSFGFSNHLLKKMKFVVGFAYKESNRQCEIDLARIFLRKLLITWNKKFLYVDFLKYKEKNRHG